VRRAGAGRIAPSIPGATHDNRLLQHVLDHPLDTVWSLIRDFNNYPAYIEGVTESLIEDDKRGDEVGAHQAVLLPRKLDPAASGGPFRRAAHVDLCRDRALSVSGRRRARDRVSDALRRNDASASDRRGQQDAHRMVGSARHRAGGFGSLASAVPILDSGVDPFAVESARASHRSGAMRSYWPALSLASSPFGRAPPKMRRPSGERGGLRTSHGTKAAYWPSA